MSQLKKIKELKKRVVLGIEGRKRTRSRNMQVKKNIAHFQQCCYPGAMGNYFADGAEVPRCEAACAICARKDFLEYRHKLRLFAELPAEAAIDSTEDLEEQGAQAAPTASQILQRAEEHLCGVSVHSSFKLTSEGTA